MSTEKLSSSYFKKSKEEFEKAWDHINTKATALVLGSTAIVAYYNRDKISEGIGSLFGKKNNYTMYDESENLENEEDLNSKNKEEKKEEEEIDSTKKTPEANQETPSNKTSLNACDTANKKAERIEQNSNTKINNHKEANQKKTTDNKDPDTTAVNQKKNVDNDPNELNNNSAPSYNNDFSGTATKAAANYLAGGLTAGLEFAYQAGKFTGGVTVLGITLNSIWEGLKAAPGSITSVPGVIVSTAYSGIKDTCSAAKEFTLGTAYFGTGVVLRTAEITHIIGTSETSDTPLSGAEDEAPGDII